MDILSFQEARRCDAVLLGDAPIARAMEMLWQAHRYAMHVGMNPWDFAIEINEFYRADVCNSELRWILSQGYADHASETSSGAEKRQFHGESSSMSLSETSCFIIAKAGLAFVESWYAAGPLATFNASMPRMLWPTPAGASNDAGERRSADLEKPAWDAFRRELWVGGRMVKQYRRPALNQQMILDAFQAARWPTHLVDPLPLRAAHCPKRRLHDAIKCLNRCQRIAAIRFSGDGSGRGVLWERVG
jgi:hypothetical protein